jgi:uncharacterized protein
MTAMSDRKDSQEPSMEEILTSIRRIIADEDRESPDSKAKEIDETPEEGEDEDDVLELTQIVGDEPAAPPPAAKGADKGADRATEKPPARPAQRPVTAEPEELELSPLPSGPESGYQPDDEKDHEPVPSKPDTLISDSAASAASGAFAKLSQAMRPQVQPLPGSGQTVEQMVAEMLRPMLKQWLDDNLPPIVERLVQQELGKLARRAELM